MPYKFVASKFKNTTPRQPKKEDTIFDLPIGQLSCTNNGIAASSNLLAFHIDGEGGKLGVLPLGATGRHLRDDLTVVCAHADTVSDFAFLPFNEQSLVTCCRDEAAKIWQLDHNANLPASLSSPTATLSLGADRMVECLAVHSTADSLVAFGSGDGALLCDVAVGRPAVELRGLTDRVQSLSWSGDGRTLAAEDKSQRISLFDARADDKPTASVAAHAIGGRESRVLFLGDTGYLLSSGFTTRRQQQINLFDVRNFESAVHSEQLESSTGVMMPFYDADTRLLFLAAKGGNKLLVYELASKAPLLSPVCVHSLGELTLGGCLLAKSQMRVMEGEVQRFVQLTKQSVVPVSCVVPRRSYRDFHADLFPHTVGSLSSLTAADWLDGRDTAPPKYSLDPAARQLFNKQPSAVPEPPEPEVTQDNSEAKVTNGVVDSGHDLTGVDDTFRTPNATVDDTTLFFTPPDERKAPAVIDSPAHSARPSVAAAVGAFDRPKAEAERSAPVVPRAAVRPRQSAAARPVSCVVGVRQSKFRHVDTLCGEKRGAIFTNLRNVNTRQPLESSAFCVNRVWAAIPIAGPGGLVAVFNLDNPRKIADGVIPGLENKAAVADLAWNPFDDSHLAVGQRSPPSSTAELVRRVGCDDGTIKLWRVPVEGVSGRDLPPIRVMQAHADKVVNVRFHPQASDVFLSTAADGSVFIWHLSNEADCPEIRLSDHSTSILSVAWGSHGSLLATVCKDAVVRLFDPRSSNEPLLKSKVLEKTTGARLVFVCDDRLLLLVHFSRMSMRQLSLYAADSLAHLHTLPLDTASQMLIPHYDSDSSVLWLSGKGDQLVRMFEVCAEEPWLLPLADFRAATGHQAISFQAKLACDVRAVEFARAWRLTERTVELLSFRVPRLKADLFQNDLFPNALVTWAASATAAEWFADSPSPPNFVSLKPDGMNNLFAPRREESDAKSTDVALDDAARQPAAAPMHREDPRAKEQLAESMAARMDAIRVSTELPQDKAEGVDDSEWTEE